MTMPKVEIRVEIRAGETYVGALTRDVDITVVPRAGEKIALTSLGLPMGGAVDFEVVDHIEHHPVSDQVTVVVRRRSHSAASLAEAADRGDPAWKVHYAAR